MNESDTPSRPAVAVADLIRHFSTKLPSLVVENIGALNSAGEWGVAIEELANMLFEDQVPLSRYEYERIARVFDAMHMPASSWEYLSSLVSDA